MEVVKEIHEEYAAYPGQIYNRNEAKFVHRPTHII